MSGGVSLLEVNFGPLCPRSSDGWGRPPLERHYSDYGGGRRSSYGGGWGGGGPRGQSGGPRWRGGGQGPDMMSVAPEDWSKPLPRQERLET